MQESLSLCAIPVILVHKKEESWRMCTDWKVMNNITVKYRHLILRYDDLLDNFMVLVSALKLNLLKIGATTK